MNNDEALVLSLKARLFEMQNAAMSLAGQLRQYERMADMDSRSDDPRKTPLERIKDAHAYKRAEILAGNYDDIEWSEDIKPEQVGLHTVWADDNGALWVIRRDGDKLKLSRITGDGRPY